MKNRVAFITGAGRGVGVECDVSDPGSVEAAVDASVERFGALDVVVANAGVGSYGPFLEMDPEDVESTGDFVSLAPVAGLRSLRMLTVSFRPMGEGSAG